MKLESTLQRELEFMLQLEPALPGRAAHNIDERLESLPICRLESRRYGSPDKLKLELQL